MPSPVSLPLPQKMAAGLTSSHWHPLTEATEMSAIIKPSSSYVIGLVVWLVWEEL